jgi:hypothetical protein
MLYTTPKIQVGSWLFTYEKVLVFVEKLNE